MSVRREAFRLLLIPIRRVPSDGRYQCVGYPCGDKPRTLTRQQASRLANQRTTTCRACGRASLAKIPAVTS